MGKSKKAAIVNSFIYANFNYCPLLGHFSTCESIRKIEKIQKRCLIIFLDDYYSERLRCPAKKKSKSSNGNKAIKSSDH